MLKFLNNQINKYPNTVFFERQKYTFLANYMILFEICQKLRKIRGKSRVKGLKIRVPKSCLGRFLEDFGYFTSVTVPVRSIMVPSGILYSM